MRSIHKSFVLLAMAVAMAVPVHAFAQNAYVFKGNLLKNKDNEHKAKLGKGLYIISMESKQFDTFLFLDNPQGQEVANDDDGGNGLNSLIKYNVEKPGVYTIVASAFNDNDSGMYIIKVSKAIQNIKGKFNGNSVPHKIKMKKGNTYVFDMTSKDFDTFLTLKDSNGTTVGTDDDGGQGLNSLLRYTAPNDGEYTIYAGSFGNQGQGDYNLITTESAPTKK